MRPAEPLVLNAAVRGLTVKMGSIPPGPELFGIFLLRAALNIVSRDWDDSVSLRVNEINEITGLLKQGMTLVPNELKSRFQKEITRANKGKRDLRVSKLEGILDGLRDALIELQAWLEEDARVEAKELLLKTWEFLIAVNKRIQFEARPW